MRKMWVQIPSFHLFSIAGLRIRIAELNPKSEITNPKSLGAVAERRMHFTVYEDDDGSSPFSTVYFNYFGGKRYV